MIFVTLAGAVILITLVLYVLKDRLPQKCVTIINFLRGKLMFNSFIRCFLQQYYTLTQAVLFNLKYAFLFSEFRDT